MKVTKGCNTKGSRSNNRRTKTKQCTWCCHRLSIHEDMIFPKIWTDLRKSDRFCDATLESNDGKIFRVHRVIMVASSDYFRVVFTSPLALHESNIILPYSSHIVDCFVDFCYTGDCYVDESNVQTLLPAANQYGVIGIIEKCVKFLSTHLTIKNVCGVFNFCRHYCFHDLIRLCRNYMLTHFVAIQKDSPEFQNMAIGDLYALISDDYLNTPDEEHVFHAVDKWIMHNMKERQHYANQLFYCIRMGFLSPDFVTQTLCQVPYLESVSPGYLIQAKASIFERITATVSLELSISLFNRPRVPFNILFAVGGWSAGSPTNCIETYDIRANRWFLTKQIDSIPRSYHGLVCIDNLLYMVGGFDGTIHFNTVRCHNPVTNSWSEKACMYHARSYVCCVAIGKDIYAIGGFNGRVRLSSAEKYSAITNQWTIINSMNKQRSDGGAVAVKKKIFVVGGFNGQEVLQSAEMYNTETGQWSMLPPMHTPRSGVSLIYFKEYLYALGGFNGYVRLSTVERLDPLHPVEWLTDVPDMLTQRSNFACAIIEDLLYVAGGFNGSTTTAYVECFDGTQWREVSSMNLNRSALAISVCSGLPNAADYTLTSRLKANDGNNSVTGDENATGDYRRS